MARMKDRITYFEGRSIVVPKDAPYSAVDVVNYVKQLNARAPGCRWDLSALEIKSLNRAAEAKGITF